MSETLVSREHRTTARRHGGALVGFPARARRPRRAASAGASVEVAATEAMARAAPAAWQQLCAVAEGVAPAGSALLGGEWRARPRERRRRRREAICVREAWKGWGGEDAVARGFVAGPRGITTPHQCCIQNRQTGRHLPLPAILYATCTNTLTMSLPKVYRNRFLTPQTALIDRKTVKNLDRFYCYQRLLSATTGLVRFLSIFTKIGPIYINFVNHGHYYCLITSPSSNSITRPLQCMNNKTYGIFLIKLF